MYKQTQAPASQTIQPSDAAEWLKLNTFPGQRPLSGDKAKAYAEKLRIGAMRPVGIDFAKCPDDRTYLVNGQHCLTACIIAGIPMKCVVTRYRCESWGDAHELFASFDVHASRTQGHIMHAARALWQNDSLRALPLRTLANCGSALIALDAGANFEALLDAGKTARASAVESHAEEVIWVYNVTKNAQHMMRVGVAAAMIATLRKRPKTATEFWSRVESGVGFKSEVDPDRKLREYLVGTDCRGSVTSRGHHAEVYAVSISWWNSYVTGKPRNSVKLAAMLKTPEAL